MRFVLLRGKRGANNVVATMLIFGLMIASIGVLYGQISPALLGYEARATTANQTYIFDTISQEVINLASSNAGSSSRIHIISESTLYDIDTSLFLNFDILNGSNSILSGYQLNSTRIGAFQARVNGSFQPTGENLINRVIDQNTYMNNNSNDASYILTSDYSYNEGLFSMYFRPTINLHEVSAGNWKLSVSIVEIDFLSPFNNENTPLIFPVSLPEWTLRLRRQSVSIEKVPAFNVADPLSITHNLSGQNGTTYTYPDLVGQTLEVEIIRIPILFGI